MDFLVLPPEVNSLRVHTGVGSGSMLAAVSAWDGLAAELRSAAASFGSVTSGLSGGSWQGPSSAAMAEVAAAYLAWLGSAAAQAEQAAAQARLAAGAFEAAFAATVHPAAVAANRAQLVSLVRSNLFGQNASAIAAVEADYEQMWAQDVAAMLGYHASASVAGGQLTPWQQLAQSLAGQARRHVQRGTHHRPRCCSGAAHWKRVTPAVRGAQQRDWRELVPRHHARGGQLPRHCRPDQRPFPPQLPTSRSPSASSC